MVRHFVSPFDRRCPLGLFRVLELRQLELEKLQLNFCSSCSKFKKINFYTIFYAKFTSKL